MLGRQAAASFIEADGSAVVLHRSKRCMAAGMSQSVGTPAPAESAALLLVRGFLECDPVPVDLSTVVTSSYKFKVRQINMRLQMR